MRRGGGGGGGNENEVECLNLGKLNCTAILLGTTTETAILTLLV